MEVCENCKRPIKGGRINVYFNGLSKRELYFCNKTCLKSYVKSGRLMEVMI